MYHLGLEEDLVQVVDERKQVDACVIDFEKAFDMVPHGTLMRKVEALILDKRVVEWIGDFLRRLIPVQFSDEPYLEKGTFLLYVQADEPETSYCIPGNVQHQKDYSRINGLPEGDEPLYNPALIKRLNFTQISSLFSPPISAANPGHSLLVRPLCRGDYDRGFLQLLSQLTHVGHISREQFLGRFSSMKACPDTYYVTVVEDTQTNKVIAAASLITELKFIHDCGLRGRLEDVVVNGDYRGKQLGKLIVMTVTLLAKELGCYKMSLDCKDKLIPFYNSLGYIDEPGNANSMTIRFDSSSIFKNPGITAKL
ncbi:hypothetical protein PR048_017153 [Dryococelus australis]|uniref:Glucosamine 6-phosphate N-acetyltransferase n=1 Tax=Dryococelus australis TaxID=614101 RepID=A0ABQ9H8Q4_9NEOP|nr:hypothetical protein PR048_017153 [Dryococelus australis]